MMRVGAIVGVLVLLFVANVYSQNTNLTAFTVQGIDMIIVDAPGWITHIQRSRMDHEIFIFGESLLRPVSINDQLGGFQVLPASSSYDITLQDLSGVYINGTNQYSFGLANYDVDHSQFYTNAAGLYVPLVILGANNFQYIQRIDDRFSGINWNGILMAAVMTDSRNVTDVQSYFAGWIVNATDVSTPYFSILRTHFDGSFSGGLSNSFSFDPVLDVAHLYSNMFTTFSPDFKPWVHLLPYYGPTNVTLVIVADPNTRIVYAGYFGTTGWNLIGSQYLDQPNYLMVSSTLSFHTQQLYVGLAQSGMNVSGIIVRIDFTNGVGVPVSYTLPQGTNNPKALALDDYNNTLYIGLNGGSKILRFSLTSYTVTGYQTLPEWLHRVWVGTDSPNLVYFATYEEHAKIFRVNKNDFCPSECPFMGFCRGGTCQCSTGFTMNNGQCEVSAQINYVNETKLFNTAHGGEIALGVLFALALIAAATGWFLWWRGRRGAYQSV